MAVKKVVVCDFCGNDAVSPSRVEVFVSREFNGVDYTNTYRYVDLCEKCVEKALQDMICTMEKINHDAALEWSHKWAKRKKWPWVKNEDAEEG